MGYLENLAILEDELSAAERKQIKEFGHKIREVARNHRNCEHPKDLKGMCAIASALLFTELTKLGYKAVLTEARGYNIKGLNKAHVYITLRGRIVDITATQFGKGKVVIRKPKKSDQWYWQPWNHYTSVNSLVANQRYNNWFPTQIADVAA